MQAAKTLTNCASPCIPFPRPDARPNPRPSIDRYANPPTRSSGDIGGGSASPSPKSIWPSVRDKVKGPHHTGGWSAVCLALARGFTCNSRDAHDGLKSNIVRKLRRDGAGCMCGFEGEGRAEGVRARGRLRSGVEARVIAGARGSPSGAATWGIPAGARRRTLSQS